MKIVIQMLATLTLIGVVSGGLLSQISEWAEPKIAEHRRAETEKAIFLVQPDAKSYETIQGVDFEVYKVLNSNKNEIGYALAYEGSGFQGKVRLMAGLNKDLNEVIGLKVLEQVETPGLGTKITEEPFLKQFLGLNASPNVAWVKGAAPSNPNEIQTITGATISSKAVVNILNDGINKLRSIQNNGGSDEK